jgi:hypothetical protein
LGHACLGGISHRVHASSLVFGNGCVVGAVARHDKTPGK